MDLDVHRRSFAQALGTLGLMSVLPGGGRSAALSPTSSGASPGCASRFLAANEMATLRAVVARLVPGPPDDPDPGGQEAGVAEAIDRLLAAFNLATPPMHAGGPFSNRAGAAHDDFADFVALDALAELGWRIRIEGSKGLAEREFAGPVIGLQEVYRRGLAHLEAEAAKRFGAAFVGLAGSDQDRLLSERNDAEAQALVGAAWAHSLEFMYGPPEYGGNRDLAGWTYTGWAGDAQPKGFSDAEVSGSGGGSLCLASPEARALVERFLGALGPRPAGSERLWSACAGPKT
jgi:hypothetical protein